MLRTITMQVRLFNGGDRELNAKGLCGFLESMTHWDEIYLDLFPDTKPLYQSGVYYSIPEPFQAGMPSPEKVFKALLKTGLPRVMAQQMTDAAMSGEQFRDIPTLYENGHGDCDNLACARAAELRFCGVDASPYITRHDRPDGGTTYHAVVRWPDGTAEDPSLLLGMGGPGRAADRAEENRRLAERREIAAAELLRAQEEGRPIDLEKARRLARYLAPVPATPEEVSSWESQADRKRLAKRSR